MNKERMQLLHDTIRDAPGKEFVYSRFFAELKPDLRLPALIAVGDEVVPEPHCGTAGCVAGWACMLFAPGQEVTGQFLSLSDVIADVSAYHRAKRLLDLTTPQADFLFVAYAERAERIDALTRMDWLMEHPDDPEATFKYPWTLEAHWEQ